MSLRTQDLVFKVDRTSGRLIWVIGTDDADTDGDDGWPFLTPLDGALIPRHQHTPVLREDGRLVIYDNGTMRGPGWFSRTVELEIDEAAGTFREVWTWWDPDFDPPVATFLAGSAYPLPNGNVLVADAGIFDSFPLGRRWFQVTEVRREDDAEVWQLRVRDDAEGVSQTTYRAVRVPSLYPPDP